MPIRKVGIFNGFERFWHWTQAFLIFTLLFTGFRIHGYYTLLSFDQAVYWHVVAALSLIVLWIFAIFWHLTTGNWRHYLPTTKGLWQVARYYAWGIFRGEEHPYKKRFWHKHNPLQALAYLGLKVGLFPVLWLTGLAYLFYGFWSQGPLTASSLEWVAVIHTLFAFFMAAFVIIHVYLLTTGHSLKEHVMPMINGYDEVDLTDAEKAYLEQDEPGRIIE